MRSQVSIVSAVVLAGGFVLADDKKASATFDSTVSPIFTKTCLPCHNDRLASGGLNIGPFNNASSLTAHREEWERILQKIRTSEMPPKGMPRPPATQTEALIKF